MSCISFCFNTHTFTFTSLCARPMCVTVFLVATLSLPEYLFHLHHSHHAILPPSHALPGNDIVQELTAIPARSLSLWMANLINYAFTAIGCWWLWQNPMSDESQAEKRSSTSTNSRLPISCRMNIWAGCGWSSSPLQSASFSHFPLNSTDGWLAWHGIYIGWEEESSSLRIVSEYS